jgi:serine/threonine protein kinase
VLWPGYGTVYRATDCRTGEVVAIKKIKRASVDDYVEQECLNLARCRHNQIIQFIEVCTLIELAWHQAADASPTPEFTFN